MDQQQKNTFGLKKRQFKVLPADFHGNFSGKDSFYEYFKVQLQLFCPPYEMVTTPFLK